MGGWGAVPPQGKRKKKKEEKKKRERKEKKRKKKEGNYELLHIKCCFFQFFNNPVTLKNKKKFGPQEKVEMTPLKETYLSARGCLFAYSRLTRLIALGGSFFNVSGDWRTFAPYIGLKIRPALLGIRLKLM